MKPNKQVIGLTGTIASGKSTAAAYFHEKYGVPVIDADKVGHEVLEDPRIIGQLTEAFGGDILVHGRIDRKKLGNKVFDDPASLERLNGITHPEICRRVHETAEAFRKSDDPAPFMLIEAYGLLQSDLKKDADAEAYRIRAVMEAYNTLSADVLIALATMDMDPNKLIARAFEKLAAGSSIGTLNITPDLLESLGKKAG